MCIKRVNGFYFPPICQLCFWLRCVFHVIVNLRSVSIAVFNCSRTKLEAIIVNMVINVNICYGSFLLLSFRRLLQHWKSRCWYKHRPDHLSSFSGSPVWRRKWSGESSSPAISRLLASPLWQVSRWSTVSISPQSLQLGSSAAPMQASVAWQSEVSRVRIWLTYLFSSISCFFRPWDLVELLPLSIEILICFFSLTSDGYWFCLKRYWSVVLR